MRKRIGIFLITVTMVLLSGCGGDAVSDGAAGSDSAAAQDSAADDTKADD